MTLRNLSLALIVFLIIANIGYSEKTARWPYAEYGATLNEEKRASLLDICNSEWGHDSSECSSVVGFPLSFMEGANFQETTFDSTADFEFADFSDTVLFWGAEFQEGTSFNQATFDSSSVVSFQDADFSNTVSFWRAKFQGGVSFDGATFDSSSRVLFYDADFSCDTVSFSGAEFQGGASFYRAIFDSSSYISFESVDFSDSISFVSANFQGRAAFEGVTFDSSSWVHFGYVTFSDTLSFVNADFQGWTSFERATFDSSSWVPFYDADFSDSVSFEYTLFQGKAAFTLARFDSSSVVSFDGADFSDRVSFSIVTFAGGGSFNWVTFEKGASFSDAVLGDSIPGSDSSVVGFSNGSTKGYLDFSGALIYCPVDFRDMKFHSTPPENRVVGKVDSGQVDLSLEYLSSREEPQVLFHNARIYDTIRVGNRGTWDPQSYDFSLALFPEKNLGVDVKPAIVLYGPVKLKMQLEKFKKYLTLGDSLSYFDKRNIIDYLKQESYAGPNYKKERFELDYLFARETAYQKESTDYEKRGWFGRRYQDLRWATLGYGYRPFRIVWLALVISIIFAVLYYWLFNGSVTNYIRELSNYKGAVMAKSKPEVMIYCLWFSISTLLLI